MMDSKLTCEQASSYNLVAYLRALGFSPVNEFCNAAFEDSSSPKYYTSFFEGQPGTVPYVIEGFFEFLSYLTLIPTQGKMQKDDLILNTLVFNEKVRPVMENYNRVNLFLDNVNSVRTKPPSLHHSLHVISMAAPCCLKITRT